MGSGRDVVLNCAPNFIVTLKNFGYGFIIRFNQSGMQFLLKLCKTVTLVEKYRKLYLKKRNFILLYAKDSYFILSISLYK